MFLYHIATLIYRAEKLDYNGNENYRIGFNLVDKDGHEYEYLQFQQFYIERRYMGDEKVGVTIYVEDIGERKEICHGRYKAVLHVAKPYQKEIINMCKRIEKDLNLLEKAKE